MSLYSAWRDWTDWKERKALGPQLADQYEADLATQATSPIMATGYGVGQAGGQPAPQGNAGVDGMAVYDGLVKRGMPPHVAAAYAGNFQQESNFNPGALNAKEGAYGLGQWRGDRRTALTNFTGSETPSFDQQLDFVVHEGQGSESAAHQRVLGAKTAGEAAGLVDDHYERSAGTERGVRQGYAEQIYRTAMARGGQPQAAPDGSIQRPGDVPQGLGPAEGVRTPFAPQVPQGVIPGTEHLPDPRLPHSLANVGIGLIRGGFFQEGLELLTPMQRYATDANIMRSKYGLDSTLTAEAHAYTTAENEQTHQNAMTRQLQQQEHAWGTQLQQQGFDAEQQARRQQFELERQQAASMPKVTPEMRKEVYDRDTALNNVDATLDWFEETSGGGRAINPADRAYYGSVWQTSVLPGLQKMFAAGAMQEGELKLFTEIGGDPTRWATLTDSEKKKMRAVRDRMKQDRDNTVESLNPVVGYDQGGNPVRAIPDLDPARNYGQNLPGRSASPPEGTKPVSVQDILKKATKREDAHDIEARQMREDAERREKGWAR